MDTRNGPISPELNGAEKGNTTNSTTQLAEQQLSTPTLEPITISDGVASYPAKPNMIECHLQVMKVRQG